MVATVVSSSKDKPIIHLKTKINLTYQKVHEFIKNNLKKLIASTLVVGSYFVLAVKVSLAFISIFSISQIATKFFKTSNKALNHFIQRQTKTRKISSSPGEKKNVVFLPNATCLHDSNKWLSEYNSTNSRKRQMLKAIGLQTLKTVEKLGINGLFSLSKSEIDTMKQNTQVIGENIKTKNDEKKYFEKAVSENTLPLKRKQKVEIFEADSFDVALSLKKENKYRNVAVLNMANQTSPGGGFLNGSSAQEESLCRRSTLFDSININPLRSNYNPYLREKMKGTYKIPEFGSIYSPKIKIFRANQASHGYAYLKKPEDVNVISSAAYDIAHKSRPSNYRENTKIKLQMILNTALQKNQECIVLGAYGCGAFGNDPKEVASIFKEILIQRPIYQQKMKIAFAIIKDRNDKGNIKNFLTLQDL